MRGPFYCYKTTPTHLLNNPRRGRSPPNSSKTGPGDAQGYTLKSIAPKKTGTISSQPSTWAAVFNFSLACPPPPKHHFHNIHVCASSHKKRGSIYEPAAPSAVGGSLLPLSLVATASSSKPAAAAATAAAPPTSSSESSPSSSCDELPFINGCGGKGGVARQKAKVRQTAARLHGRNEGAKIDRSEQREKDAGERCFGLQTAA